MINAHQGKNQPGPDVRRPGSACRSPEAEAGDIVLINGIDEVGVGTTLCHPEHPDALPMLTVDEPTLTMNFLVNASPLAGREGKFLTSRQIRERLERETKSNVAMRVEYPGRHRHLHRARPRRAAPDDPAGEHAPRGLRNRGVAPARDLQGDRRREVRAVRSAHRGRRGHQPGRRDGRARPPPRRAARHAARRQGARAPRLPHPGARADRLPGRIHDPHARHRRDEPRVRRVRAGQGRADGRAAQRRAGVAGRRRHRRLRHLEAAGARPHVRQPRRAGVRGHDRRHPQPRQRPRRSTRSAPSSSPTSAPRARTRRSTSCRRSA